MEAEIVSISNMQEVKDTADLLICYSWLKAPRLIPILSQFYFLKDIEIDENLSRFDSFDHYMISKEPNINKVCINCGRKYKTRFPDINLCSLACKKEMNGEYAKV